MGGARLIKVLVIDDSPLVPKVVEHYLKQHGWQVQGTNGPFGALKKIKEFRPDVILLDLNMPGLSGKSLAVILKEKKEYFNYKVISFSSVEEERQKEMVDRGLVDGYFIKCHTLSGLREAIETVRQ